MSTLSNAGNPQVHEASDQIPKKAEGPDDGAPEAMEQKTQIPQEDENSQKVMNIQAMARGGRPSKAMEMYVVKKDQGMIGKKDEAKVGRDEAAQAKEKR